MAQRTLLSLLSVNKATLTSSLRSRVQMNSCLRRYICNEQINPSSSKLKSKFVQFSEVAIHANP
jgi:hypothetical protein